MIDRTFGKRFVKQAYDAGFVAALEKFAGWKDDLTQIGGGALLGGMSTGISTGLLSYLGSSDKKHKDRVTKGLRAAALGAIPGAVLGTTFPLFDVLENRGRVGRMQSRAEAAAAVAEINAAAARAATERGFPRPVVGATSPPPPSAAPTPPAPERSRFSLLEVD